MVKNFETIIWEKIEDIGILTLNRPDRFNAVNDTLVGEVFSTSCSPGLEDSSAGNRRPFHPTTERSAGRGEVIPMLINSNSTEIIP